MRRRNGAAALRPPKNSPHLVLRVENLYRLHVDHVEVGHLTNLHLTHDVTRVRMPRVPRRRHAAAMSRLESTALQVSRASSRGESQEVISQRGIVGPSPSRGQSARTCAPCPGPASSHRSADPRRPAGSRMPPRETLNGSRDGKRAGTSHVNAAVREMIMERQQVHEWTCLL